MNPGPRVSLRKRARRSDAGDDATQTAPLRQSKRSKPSKKQSDASSFSISTSAQSRVALPTPPGPGDTAESQLEHDDCRPSHVFPFMKLPAELRVHVYHMALHRCEPLLLHAHRTPDKQESYSNDTDPLLSPSAPVVPVGGHLAQLQSRLERHRSERMPPPDPIVPQILLLSKEIYKEARQVLYSENVFILDLSSGIYTLSTLHQRSRSLIKHAVLTIPSHHDILDGFADLVRLGLRYCWGLKSFKIILQASLPDDSRVGGGATSVYANAFHILRWLPRSCRVILEGSVSEAVKRVVEEEGRLQSVLDEEDYLKRQHQMPERH